MFEDEQGCKKQESKECNELEDQKGNNEERSEDCFDRREFSRGGIHGNQQHYHHHEHEHHHHHHHEGGMPFSRGQFEREEGNGEFYSRGVMFGSGIRGNFGGGRGRGGRCSVNHRGGHCHGGRGRGNSQQFESRCDHQEWSQMPNEGYGQQFQPDQTNFYPNPCFMRGW